MDTQTETTQIHTVETYGISSDRNASHRRTMEDAHCIFEPLIEGETTYSLFAIFDGHGGKAAAQYSATNFPEIMKTLLLQNDDKTIEEKLTIAFSEVDIKMKESGIDFPGACALVMIVVKKGNDRKIYVANAGDSCGYLIKNNSPIALSEEHNTKNPSEKERITTNGGLIFSGRVNGMIAITRALGDHHMKQWIINTPYISTYDIDNECSHIILACDGLWDGITPQKAVEIITQNNDMKAASKLLLQAAIAGGSMDNISVIAVKL